MAEILKGIEVANAMREGLIAKCDELKAKGVAPCLAIVRVGERPDDLAYERGVLKRFEGLGIKVRVEAFDEKISQGEFELEFGRVNEENDIHGILLFQPLPKNLDSEAVKKAINPRKDVDCMCEANMAKVFKGDDSGYVPCTPMAVMEILKHFEIPVSGKDVTIVGRSVVVGKPLSMLLLGENATVTICHSKTADLAEKCRRADILIAAAGVAKMIRADFIKPGAVVIDVGINIDDAGNLCGDVDFEKAENIASRITPVPGGVGSVTTSILASNTLKSADMVLNNAG